MNKNFIMIDFDILKTDVENSLLAKIGTESFTVYSYLLMTKGLCDKNIITIKQIKHYFDGIEGFKSNKTIWKYLKILDEFKLIHISNETDQEKISENTLIIYKVDNNPKQFIRIPVGILENEITRIGSVGFSILCLLSKLHNSNYGGVGCVGFSNPSMEYIALVINKHRNTVIKYIDILKKQKLIKVENQGLIEYQNNLGYMEYKYENNHYLVQHIINNKNKYYIGR